MGTNLPTLEGLIAVLSEFTEAGGKRSWRDCHPQPANDEQNTLTTQPYNQYMLLLKQIDNCILTFFNSGLF